MSNPQMPQTLKRQQPPKIGTIINRIKHPADMGHVMRLFQSGVTVYQHQAGSFLVGDAKSTYWVRPEGFHAPDRPLDMIHDAAELAAVTIRFNAAFGLGSTASKQPKDGPATRHYDPAVGIPATGFQPAGIPYDHASALQRSIENRRRA